MTKKEAIKEFATVIQPVVLAKHNNVNPNVVLYGAWDIWLIELKRHGRITEQQYDTWTNPFDLPY